MSVIDRDESLYLLIAESWLNGNPPYTEIWDNKPPGIFLLLAIAFQIFGEPIFAMRFLAIISVTFTCYFLYLIGKNIDDHQGKYIGLLAGILYSIYSLNNGGTATNGEIIFAPFVTAGMAIFWQISQELNKQNQFKQDQQAKLPLLKIFTMGLLFGLAMQIKYVVVTEIVFGFIFLTSYVILTEKNLQNFQFLTVNFWRKLIKVLLCFTGGLILPLLAIALYYLFIGDFAEYIYATITANTKYVAGTSFNINLFTKVINRQISRNFLLWSSLLYLPIYYCFIRLKQKYQFNFLTEINIIYLLIWLIFTFISVSISKKFFPHYFLQILPPLCLITSFLIIKTIYI
ncbi:MAG: ArnT family glycosyltransferase, partial [Microcoleaceae cyanobacterium]